MQRSNSIAFAVFNLLFLWLVSGEFVDFSDKTRLLKLKNAISDPYNMLSSWNPANPNHCSWFGVTCNSRARVSELRIPGGKFIHSDTKGKFLGGMLSNVIGDLLELRVLSVPFNQLSGELPDAIWGLKNLEVIDIEGNSITGNLSMIDFADLNKLQVLNFGFNRLFGEIPKSIAECEGLSVLNLAGNRIDGAIPVFVGSIMKLKRVNLSRNRFSRSLLDGFWSECRVLEHVDFSGNFLDGEIPKSVRNCGRLRTLLLFSNAFGGGVPSELGMLENLEVLDISRNRFVGNIPVSLVNSRSLVKFDFSSNNFSEPIMVDPAPVVSLPSLPPQHRRALGGSGSVDRKKKGFTSLELVLIVVASLIVLALISLIVAYLYMRNRRRSSQVEGIPSPPRSGTKRLVIFKEVGAPLTFDTVVQATGNFTSRNCIGNGGFGSTYRAEISPGITVAVKRLTVEMCQGVPQFKAEIRSLGRIRHPNLITLIGYYASLSEMFLVYNYLPGGSLEEFICEKRNHVIGLETVHKIAIDVAAALAFLHDECNPRILHRDVKPSNILLDKDLKPYLSDFGLSRLLEGFETHVTTGVAGTFGYVAPEYALTCRASDKVDVYSYGVMLLELISDKRALDPSFSSQENGYTIVSWATRLWQEGRMEEVFAAGMWESGPENVLLELLQLGLICTEETSGRRPKMRQVVRILREIQSAFDH
ncbi:hypothetical protein L6452_13226 [Arctium lappa]|uniref:Uncharacterized protein n=1 Tax=Arctium lappa TaxID=4217 RepID=A0ACB9CHQ1_ARCLA|nr:hypothetical protein L6452_13226 [Arctium lappa]